MIDGSLFIAQTVNFVLLIALLYYLLYKPVRTFMDKRTEEIQGQIRNAEENQAAAAALRNQLEEQAKDSRQQARQFLDEAAKRAEAMQAEMIKEARDDAAAIIRRAQEVTDLEKEKAWAELKGQVGELSLLLASKVINDSLDQSQHERLIEQAMSQLDSLGKGNLQ